MTSRLRVDLTEHQVQFLLAVMADYLAATVDALIARDAKNIQKKLLRVQEMFDEAKVADVNKRIATILTRGQRRTRSMKNAT